jgi:hypothetical protein
VIPAPELADRLAQRAGVIGYDLVAPVARLLTVARDTFGGDLDKALLMMVITLRSGGHPEYRKLTPAMIKAGAVTTIPSFGTNLRSLAESTGVPRESVRRKVKDLIEAGWIERIDGRLQHSLAGYHAIAPVRAELHLMFARIHQVVDLELRNPLAEAV